MVSSFAFPKLEHPDTALVQGNCSLGLDPPALEDAWGRIWRLEWDSSWANEFSSA
jgi:hypothetical protein